MNNTSHHWYNQGTHDTISYKCGYEGCGLEVASEKGWYFEGTNPSEGLIRICPRCKRPTFFDRSKNKQFPGSKHGNVVNHLPKDVGMLYEEARDAFSSNAPTCTVLAVRKLLMHVAVEKGAQPNQKFVEYVNYLEQNHLINPEASNWVDRMREKGNEANHEIKISAPEEATEMLDFMEMLLKMVYEFPGRVRKVQPVK